MGMAFEQGLIAPVYHPGDMGLRKTAAERGEYGQRMDNVPQGAGLQKRDAAWGDRRKRKVSHLASLPPGGLRASHRIFALGNKKCRKPCQSRQEEDVRNGISGTATSES